MSVTRVIYSNIAILCIIICISPPAIHIYSVVLSKAKVEFALEDEEYLYMKKSYEKTPIQEMNVSLDFTTSFSERFRHFWRSTGMSPPSGSDAADFLLSLDQQINLALIGSLPNKAISQVRIHWMLNLISAEIKARGPEYNFTLLDSLQDRLHANGLKPGFEVMGNPSKIYNDFENKTQVIWWEDLIHQIARRYIDRFGIRWVNEWNWESWNEPDHHDFDDLSFTEKGFLEYFDATYKGLQQASPSLKYGGPGASCRLSNFSRLCWLILQHCNAGHDTFSTKIKPKIDFISIHKKGVEDVESMISQELLTLKEIRRKFRNLRQIPIFNDEADFMKGWWKPREWKSDNRYSTLVARSVSLHSQLKSSNNVNSVHRLSFDNAFLNQASVHFFNQRTLLTRFVYNESITNKVEFIKKPSYFIMSLLSLLGNHVIPTERFTTDHRVTILATFRKTTDEKLSREKYKGPSVVKQSLRPLTNKMRYDNKCNTQNKSSITTMENGKILNILLGHSGKIEKDQSEIRTNNHMRNGNQKRNVNLKINATNSTKKPNDDKQYSKVEELTILLSFSNGTEVSPERMRINLNFILPQEFLGTTLFIREYTMDDKNKMGPERIWKMMGSPKYPNFSQLRYMRSFEGVSESKTYKLSTNTKVLQRSFVLGMPSLKLLHICSLDRDQEPVVTKLNIMKIGHRSILLTWSDQIIATRCVLRYEVYFSSNPAVFTFKLLEGNIQLNNNYQRTVETNDSLVGWYSVKTVLYDNRKGPFSNPVQFKS